MSKNHHNRLLVNMMSYASLQVVNLLVGLFLPRLYLAVYGSEINGVISTVNSFTSYFTYLEAGLGLTLIHSLFKPLAENNTSELNGILSYSKKRYQNISFIYFVLVVAFSLIFPITKATQDIGKIEFALLVFVIGIYGALDFFTMSKYRVLLTADRKEYVISNAMTLAQICRFAFTWILLQFEMSVVIVKLVPIFTLLIRSLILRLYIKKKYENINYNSKEHINIETSKSHWDALLLQISISTSVSLPTIIISQILDYKEANVYAVYSLVISAMISITSSLSSGVSPMLGRSIAEGKSINKTYEIFDFVVAIIISIVFSITAVMLLPFVKLYTNVVDDINYIHPLYAILISIWGALYAYRIPVTAVINAAGIYTENRTHNIINLVMQFALCVIAAIFWGIPGLIIVMIISSLQRNISLTIVNNKVLLHSSIKNCILYQILMIVLIAASFCASYSIISNIEVSIVKWCLVAFLVAIIEAILCIAVFVALNHKVSQNAIQTLLSKLYKKA